MRYTLSIREQEFADLMGVLFAVPGAEGAAYLRCGWSRTPDELRLLVRSVSPVDSNHCRRREHDRLEIVSDSYVGIAKRARQAREGLLFVHSHPAGIDQFSTQDDREEPHLMTFFRSRLPDAAPVGTAVTDSPNNLKVRVWTGGGWVIVDRIRVIGTKIRIFDHCQEEASIPPFFDRQVRAFGPDIQRLLGRLHVGVVGAGGTGSAIIEQLLRLGMGTISIFDGEAFDKTNVNRVYGSTVHDHGSKKVLIQQAHATRIGLGTTVHVYPKPITDRKTAEHLRDCDVIFGCTDLQAPRGILVQLSLRYLIPCLDMGVKIDSLDGWIRGIEGRVTTLMPGEACLFCRRRISARTIMSEGLPPERREALAREGYADNAGTTEPAVVMFTTAVASQAIMELLHRLTGFMGNERVSTEVLLLLHQTRLRTNRVKPDDNCICAQRDIWARGDSRDFLDLTWPETQ